MGNGTAVTRTIVEVETTDGVIGLGETNGAYAARIITEQFAPKVTGLDALNRHSVARACVPTIGDYGTVEQPAQIAAFAGVELALWDIAGKATGLPVFKLLGGTARPYAPFVAYAYTVDLSKGCAPEQVPDIMAKIAQSEIARTGARMFEFKVARHSVEIDIETVLAVRAALGPSVEIGVDANMRYSLSTARRFLGATSEAHLSNIEEPCAHLADCARLSREYRVGVSTHCTDFDALRCFPDIDGVVASVDAQGGIGPIMDLARGVSALRRQFWLRSCVESGVAWAAMVHLGMSCLALERPSQALMQWIDDDLVEGDPWVIRNGGVVAPSRPGLGISIDRAAFERAAKRFERDGERTLH